jgi:glycosyltransferase involved in cell wall biosynthesis
MHKGKVIQLRIVQVMDALDYGDGVSISVINTYRVLSELGYDTAIYSKWRHDKCQDYFHDIRKLHLGQKDILIHHYSGWSCIQDEINSQNCIKVLLYHNITPKDFMREYMDEYDDSQGIQQLKDNIRKYHFILGDSQFNIEEISRITGKSTKEMDVLPIVIEFDMFRKTENARKSNRKESNFLFVGRVAPNKKFEDVIEIFNLYYSRIDSSVNLFLVGNDEYSLTYTNSLKALLSTMPCSGNVHFAGKVSDETLHNHYAEADVFLCMSEHEGFCIPILEAMSYQIPVIAYCESAIPTTMGNAGVLIFRKDFEMIAKLICVILKEDDVRRKIIDAQNQWVSKFDRISVELNLNTQIAKWVGSAG